MKDVSAVALFCEDIRREAAARETLIGVMPDTIRIPRVPGVLRRLVIHARIRVNIDYVDFDRSIRISLSGTPDGLEVRGATEGPIPKELLERSLARAKEFGLPYASVYGQIRLDEPVPIKEVGTLMVYLHCGDEKEVCGLLNISIKNDATASLPPASQSPPDVPASS